MKYTILNQRRGIEILENFNFTNEIINKFPKILNKCKKSIELLTKNRNLIHSNLNSKPYSHTNLIIAAEKLLKDCQKLGALPFSTMARISFIGSILLKSLPENDKIPKKFSENFNVKTITKSSFIRSGFCFSYW